MKIVMFSQTFCAPCRQLKPHLDAAAKQLGYEVEVWNIAEDGSNWNLCQEYGVTYTPTVLIVHDDGGFERLATTDPKIQPPNALAIKSELEQYL